MIQDSYTMDYRDDVYRSKVPLICVCDNHPSGTFNNEENLGDTIDNTQTTGVLRPLSKDGSSVSSKSDWSALGSLHSDWPANFFKRKSQFFKSGSSASGSSSSTPVRQRGQTKSLSDDNLLSPNAINRRNSFLRQIERQSSSYSPSSILTTSSSPRLSTQTFTSSNSKTQSSSEDSPPVQRNQSHLIHKANSHLNKIEDITNRINKLQDIPERSNIHADKLFHSYQSPNFDRVYQGQRPVSQQYPYHQPPVVPQLMTSSYHSDMDPPSEADKLQRYSLQPYQFIEDYEHISPRLIHNANLMHHLNSLQRTSLLEPTFNSEHRMTPEFNEFIQNSSLLQTSLQKNLRDHHQSSNLPPQNISDPNAESQQQLPENPSNSIPNVTQPNLSVSTSSYQIVKKNSNPSPLKGILVKHKNSKSMSSIAQHLPDSQLQDQSHHQQTFSQSQNSKLNRASLHLPLTSCHLSPPRYSETAGDNNCDTLDATDAVKRDHSDDNIISIRDSKSFLLDNPNSLESFSWSDIGVQTEIHYENKVSCATTAKLLLGVIVSAFGLVFVIFVMKCKFKIGFQMNMCYYM